MLVHPWDAPVDESEWRAVLASYPFGILTTLGLVDGWPVAVPTSSPSHGQTRSSCTWRGPTRCGERWGPTTYYAAVVVAAHAEVVDDADGKAAILRAQLADVQPGVEVADPSEHGRTLSGIRGIRLRVDHVRAKLKYGGNVDDAHRAVVAEHLQERRGPGDSAALTHMRRRHPFA